VPEQLSPQPLAAQATHAERVAVVGTGAIACGLAALAARHGDVLMLARSDASGRRAREELDRLCDGIDEQSTAGGVEVVLTHERLREATFVVEAVVEDAAVKTALLAELGRHVPEQALLATTTSSLSVAELATASGRPACFVGLHVFNPVARMRLVELCFPAQATERTRERARAMCATLERTAVEVPDLPGFVVNRLLFPYLFSAVRLLEQTGMTPQDVDLCMRMGAGHPMGPLALLDLVGLDVSCAIAQAIDEPIPDRVAQLVAQGRLGRKTAAGFHDYPAPREALKDPKPKDSPRS